MAKARATLVAARSRGATGNRLFTCGIGLRRLFHGSRNGGTAPYSQVFNFRFSTLGIYFEPLLPRKFKLRKFNLLRGAILNLRTLLCHQITKTQTNKQLDYTKLKLFRNLLRSVDGSGWVRCPYICLEILKKRKLEFRKHGSI